MGWPPKTSYGEQGAENMHPGSAVARCGKCGFAMTRHAPMDDGSAYDEVRFAAQAHVKKLGHTVQLKRPAFGQVEVHAPGKFGGVAITTGKNRNNAQTEQKYVGKADSRFQRQGEFTGMKVGNHPPVGSVPQAGGKAEMYGNVPRAKAVSNRGDFDHQSNRRGIGGF